MVAEPATPPDDNRIAASTVASREPDGPASVSPGRSAEETTELVVERDGHVVTVTLNRPERHNALSGAMMAGLVTLAEEFTDDPGVRVVVLRGAGERAFVSGADIGQLGSGIDGGRSTGNRPSMFPTAVPVIAMIRGYCIGGGLALALESDLRIAADDAVFSIPAGRLGIAYPNDAVERLVAMIGAARATRLLFTGERIDAAQALALGLVDEVVAPDELAERVSALAGTIAANAPLSMRAAKASVLAAVRGGRPDAVAAAVAAAQVCWHSDDFIEGRAAFGAKRPPAWTGR